jgi:hypothetical protein
MKLNELINAFEVFISNEEKEVLERIEGLRPMEAYTERERFVIESLVRKSLVSKVKHNYTFMVMKNDRY